MFNSIRKFFFGTSKRIVYSLSSCYVFVLFVCAFYYQYSITQGVDSFFDALYFSFITMTTVGYGDISPDTIKSKIVVFFQVSSGLALFGVIVSFLVKDHEESVMKKERDIEEGKKKNVFSKYSKKLISVSENFERSIYSLLECDPEVNGSFENVRFSSLANMYQQSNHVRDGFIVNRIDNYMYRRDVFLREIEFMVLNFDIELVAEFSEDIFQHLSESQKRDFVPFFSNLDSIIVGDKVKFKVKDAALIICQTYSERPGLEEDTNLLNPFIDLYDDVMDQKKIIEKIREKYTWD